MTQEQITNEMWEIRDKLEILIIPTPDPNDEVWMQRVLLHMRMSQLIGKQTQ